MPLYLTRFRYTPETWAKLIQNPEDHERQQSIRRPEAKSLSPLCTSTVSKTVVWTELSAPPAPMASAVAAIETLSGASHKVYPS